MCIQNCFFSFILKYHSFEKDMKSFSHFLSKEGIQLLFLVKITSICRQYVNVSQSYVSDFIDFWRWVSGLFFFPLFVTCPVTSFCYFSLTFSLWLHAYYIYNTGKLLRWVECGERVLQLDERKRMLPPNGIALKAPIRVRDSSIYFILRIFLDHFRKQFLKFCF